MAGPALGGEVSVLGEVADSDSPLRTYCNLDSKGDLGLGGSIRSSILPYVPVRSAGVSNPFRV